MPRVLSVGVIGDRTPGFAPHESIAESLAHTGSPVEVTWLATAGLEPARVAAFDGVWCAQTRSQPGAPHPIISAFVHAMADA